MSESRILSRQEAFSDHGGIVASSFTVAVLMSAIGWFFVQEAVWQTQHLLTGMISFCLLAIVVNILWITQHEGGRFGEANQATLLRAGLVCLIAGTLLATGTALEIGWHLIGLIAVALALDGVDGFLARRLGLTSTFGARFDMEIDALLLLILSVLVWQTGQAGAWVLMIGLMRYAFVVSSWIWPRLAAPLYPSFRRKTICALQGIALLACLLPPLDQTGGALIASSALTALILSFGLDIRFLLKGSRRFPPLIEEADT